MIEAVIVLLIVSCAATYWYARLFPRSWRRFRGAIGLPADQPAVPSGGCGSCSGCKVGCKSHQ